MELRRCKMKKAGEERKNGKGGWMKVIRARGRGVPSEGSPDPDEEKRIG